jgi:hypothetical protein
MTAKVFTFPDAAARDDKTWKENADILIALGAEADAADWIAAEFQAIAKRTLKEKFNLQFSNSTPYAEIELAISTQLDSLRKCYLDEIAKLLVRLYNAENQTPPDAS